MRRSRGAALAAVAGLLTLAGCSMVGGQLEREGALIDSPVADWTRVATQADRDRLHGWRAAFAQGLSEARAGGAGAQIATEGSLLAPDAALPGPALPNGNYACRTIKLGARTAGMRRFGSYPAAACRVRAERGIQQLAQFAGQQRPVGLVFPADALRSVFLGTLILADENRAMQYGGDPDRDMAGYVERIGARRWRLILPRPALESQIEIIELVPAS